MPPADQEISDCVQKKEIAVRKCVIWLSVALAVCFVVSMAYAQREGGKPKGEKAKGDMLRVVGKVTEIVAETKTITLKKEGGDATVDIVVNDATKIVAGKDVKTFGDIKEGMTILVGYKVVEGKNVAGMIQLKPATGKHEGGKEKARD